MRRLVWILVLVLIAAFAVSVWREPLFWKRYLFATVHAPTNLPKSFYIPAETVTGSDGPEPPRVDPQLEQLDIAALRAAAAYADSRDTTALIVARHGHIVFEQYWDDKRFDAIADLGDFNATIAAL